MGTSAHTDKAEAIREDLRKRKELMDAARKELPYTFEVPSTYEELQIVLAGRSPEYQGVIVERMIKCTHPSLASGNKEKLAHLFNLLMQHLHDAGSADENENVCYLHVHGFSLIFVSNLIFLPCSYINLGTCLLHRFVGLS